MKPWGFSRSTWQVRRVGLEARRVTRKAATRFWQAAAVTLEPLAGAEESKLYRAGFGVNWLNPASWDVQTGFLQAGQSVSNRRQSRSKPACHNTDKPSNQRMGQTGSTNCPWRSEALPAASPC